MGSTERSVASERGIKGEVQAFAAARGMEALGTAGICVALGIILPLFVHPFGLSPRVILPMHFPVFLAGLLLMPQYAALVGILAPALSMGLTGFPTTAQALRMIPELAVYGTVTAMMLRALPVWPGLPRAAGRMLAMATAMLVAMLAGRLAFIGISAVMSGLQTLHYYVLILITPAIPGMIAQLIVVPPIASRLEKLTHPSA